MSVRIKLTITFVVISLMSVLLVAVFIGQMVINEFNNYVQTQRRNDLISILSDHYTANQTWEGLELGGTPIPAPPGSGPNPPNSGNPNAGLIRVTEDQPNFGFAVADDLGRIFLPFGNYLPGTTLSKAELAAGEPVVVDGVTVATVFISTPNLKRTAEEAAYIARTTNALILAAGTAVLLALILGIISVRIFTRPLLELRAAVERIARGDFSRPVPVHSHDEFGVLAAQFNQMSDDLDRSNSLRRQMTADIAHELRSPLTVITGYLESLKDGVFQPTTERFAMLHNEALLLERLVDDLRTLSLADAGELPLNRQLIDPYTLLVHTVEAFQDAAARKNITLNATMQDLLPNLLLDAERMNQVLNNLVRNALRHTPNGGKVTLISAQQATHITIQVQDSGKGVPADLLPDIFERFTRGDAARGHSQGETGLGLAIVRSIVEAHGGTISVESPGTDQGSTFIISLPIPPERSP